MRKATSEDIPAFIEIEKQAPLKIYSAMTTDEEWQKELAKENAMVYAIVKGGKVVGNVSYEIKDKDTVYISGLCIGKEVQGKGIGKEVVRLLLDELKKFNKIELATHPENHKAIKIYKSFGFEITSRVENYFGEGEPRIILTKENKN